MMPPLRAGERSIRVACALIGVVLTIAAGLVALTRVAWPVTSLSYDLPFFAVGGGGTGEICIIYIDGLKGETLDREVQPALLQALSQTGARAVAYDILFDAPWADPSVDAAFAEAMLEFRGVDAEGNGLEGRPQRQVFLAFGRETYREGGVLVEQLIPPVDGFLDAMSGYGLIAYEDEVFQARRLTTGTPDKPSLAWAVASNYNEDLVEDSRLDPRWLNFSETSSGIGRISQAAAIPSCRASAVLAGRVHRDFFQNKIVLVGGAPGIVGEALGKDLFATPHHRLGGRGRVPLMSGVELQATMMDNLLGGNWLTRTVPSREVLLLLVAGLVLGVLFVVLKPMHGIIAAIAVALGLFMAGVLSVHYARVWFPWSALALVQLPVGLLWGIGSRFYLERFFRIKLTEEQRVLRDAFKKYLSPQMLDQLTESGFSTALGGKKVEVAVLFTDIANFTEISERVGDPERIVHDLNDYFKRTTAQIFKHEGVVIKFIGDAILAGWGAPVGEPEAAKKAVRAAWELLGNASLTMDGDHLQTRLGIHFGEVVAGNIGSDQHIDYTYIGDAVNLAARLEGLNKLLGTQILLSGEVHAQLDGEYVTRRVGSFRVKGRTETTEVFELLGPAESTPEPTWLTSYGRALAAMAGGDLGRAAELFREVDGTRTRGDGPSRFLLERISRGEGLIDGAVTLMEK